MTTSTERDVRGRLSESTDENGYITEYAINETGTSTTITHPNGETSTTVTYLDGRHKSTTGAAVTPSFTSYSTASGKITTTRYTLTDGDHRYVETVSNMLGQTVTTEAPALSGTTATSVTTTNYYEAGTGYLVRVSSTAANVPHTIMEYNSIGVLTRRGQSQDTTLTLASDDRITDIVSGVKQTAHWFFTSPDALWSTQETIVYPTLNSATQKSVTTSRTQLAGFVAGEMSWKDQSDINGNLSYQRGLAVLSSGVANGLYSNVTKEASNTAISFEVTYHGRTSRTSTPGVTGLTTYEYDSLGRQIHAKDPRHSNQSETIYIANSNQVDKVINAAGEETEFTYYAQGSLGAGNVSTTTLPDTTETFAKFDARGRTIAIWGSQTYPRWYGYDGYNQLTALYTWQSDPGITLTTATPPAGSAVTKWIYDDATGLLLEKQESVETDADPFVAGVGPEYEYDTAGRLSRRTDARSIQTDYAYTVWGQLDTVTYTGDPTQTRPLDYDYDRLGRLDEVTQTATTNTPNTNTHDFSYNPGNLLIDKEELVYGTSLNREIDYRQDTYLRSDQYLVVDPGSSTTEHQVDYSYRAADGRFDDVQDQTNTTRTFTYGYETSNYGLVKTITGPVHTVRNSYEADRDILASKINEVTVSTSYPSTFDYAVNSLGQRTSVGPVAAINGSPITTDNPVNWGWGYNSRGEVESADHGDDSTANANDRYYAFDAIGNRDYVRHGVYQDSSGAKRQYTADFANEYDDVDTNGTSVTQGYDANGNMTSGQVPADQGSASSLTWDAENRLTKAVVDGITTIYEYDYMGRRIRKEVQDTTTVTTRYIYNGWNLCAEYDGVTGLKKVYTWGMDLSGSMQGAGGVGGLLMVTEDPGGTPSEYYPTYDGNGNVSEYLDGTGAVVAHYEYDAFGDIISSSGTKVGNFAYRFSTKYLDDETGLYYYGYRYYDPVTGRWPSRDPIEEEGGINLYGMVGNDAVNGVDYLGQRTTLLGGGKLHIDDSCDDCPEAYENFSVLSEDGNGQTLEDVPDGGGEIDALYSPDGIAYKVSDGFRITIHCDCCDKTVWVTYFRLGITVWKRGNPRPNKWPGGQTGPEPYEGERPPEPQQQEDDNQ